MPRGGRYRSPEYTARVLAAYDAAEGKTRTARAKAAAAVAGVDRATVLRVVAERDGDGRDGKGPGAGSKTARCPERATETAEATEPHVTISGDAVEASGRGPAHSLAELLDSFGVDSSRWQVSHWTINEWGNADDLRWQAKAGLEPVPDFLADSAPPPVLRRLPVAPDPGRPRLALVAGDAHCGFRRDLETGALDPYHDERALDLLLQLAARLRPDAVVLAGDMVDLPALSTKFRRAPEERYLTTEALRRLRALLVALRTTLPAARIVLLPGNHEERLRKYLLDRAGELATLRAPDGAAVLSVPALLWLDSLDVELRDEVWLGPCRVWHGDLARPRGGRTVAEYLPAAHPQVVGHVHRAEYGERTYRTATGPATVWAASVGCLCRVDGAVPGSPDVPDWHQGCGAVEWTETAAEWLPLPIRDGRCRVGLGQWLAARPDSCSSQAAA
jgi:hypothetical protein